MSASDQSPQPASSVPSYLQNGESHQPLPGSPLRAQKTSVRPKEREKLVASIRSSSEGRQPVQFGPEPETLKPPEDGSADPEAIKEQGILPSKHEVAISRPASPYTQNPPIDFDGLSWPSVSP